MKKILLAALLIVAIPQTALAIDPDVAKGVLTVGKEKIKLTHSYAHRFNNEEGIEEGPELRILLADRELPVAVLAGLEGPRNLDRMARAGEVRGMLLRLDPLKPADRVQGTVLVAPRDPRASLIFFTSSGNDEFRELKVDQLRVSGELQYSSDTQKFFDDLPQFSCSSTFSAPLFHDEPLTAKLSGMAAVSSPQAQALRSYTAALARGDFEGVRRHATDGRWADVEAQRKNMGDKEFADIVKRMAASPAELDRQISRVFVRGSHATIVLKEQGGTATQALVQEDGSWKVD